MYLFKLVLALFLIFLLCGCVGKKPDDDVALIKQVLGKFERGIEQTSQTVLDSIVLDKKQGLSRQLLDSLSMHGRLAGGKIANKTFVIVKDSAQVNLRLSLRFAAGGEESEAMDKPLTLFLHKKRGKWSISRFAIPAEESKPEGN